MSWFFRWLYHETNQHSASELGALSQAPSIQDITEKTSLSPRPHLVSVSGTDLTESLETFAALEAKSDPTPITIADVAMVEAADTQPDHQDNVSVSANRSIARADVVDTSDDLFMEEVYVPHVNKEIVDEHVNNEEY